MKQIRPYPRITVTKKAEASLVQGHPWIYDAELIAIHAPEGASAGQGTAPGQNSVTEAISEESIPNGSLVDVFSTKDRYLGTGFISHSSKIRIRLISRNANDTFDEAFWRRRLSYAWNYRKTVMQKDISCCRIIFGEADQFPGLTVDRFGDYLVAQTLSVGMENLKGILFPALVEMLNQDGHPIAGLYERNDVAIRAHEGLPETKGWFPLPDLPTPDSTLTRIVENGITYTVDVENGQKTGFFLDQKYNRAAVARMAPGLRVLDCFTHTGSFALNAARGGAAHVTAVDVSASAIDMARSNAVLNHLEDRMDFVVADVFDLLPSLEEKGGHPYDMIILDPPAFTKSRRTMDNALRGYKEINLRAMRLLPRGGYLATCSCSHFADEAHFRAMLQSAARDANVQLRQIEARQQGPDHPILWNVPETDYLKFFIFQVI